jgi:hypothetical protein
MAKGHDKFQFSVNGAFMAPETKSWTVARSARLRAGTCQRFRPDPDRRRPRPLDQHRGGGQVRQRRDPVFLSFASDRTYNFTVNERGWEWGSPSILAADIYRYGEIDEELELILDSAGDAVIPTDGRWRWMALGSNGSAAVNPRW